mmetsp:Transcript_13884/g.43503  ORF Transcript_13884/g.43503 Transcript_13884/m.43503 type:complete len:232 (-) Transcript_13884:179-874(-)
MMRVSAPKWLSSSATARSCSARGATTTSVLQPALASAARMASAPLWPTSPAAPRPKEDALGPLPRGKASTRLRPQSCQARFAAETRAPVRKATQSSLLSAKSSSMQAASSRSPLAMRSGVVLLLDNTSSSWTPSTPRRRPGGNSTSIRGMPICSATSMLAFSSSAVSCAVEGNRTLSVPLKRPSRDGQPEAAWAPIRQGPPAAPGAHRGAAAVQHVPCAMLVPGDNRGCAA